MSDLEDMHVDVMGPLYREHLALGASFACGHEGRLFAEAYEGEKDQAPADSDAFLSDLGGSAYLLVSGAQAQPFVEMALAGTRLAVGECAFEPALMGDGALASVALVARTGSREYVVLDPSERGEVLAAWLGFLRDVEQGGVAPFASVTIAHADALLAPLALWGAGEGKVLADYVPSADLLPKAGRVDNVDLDRIRTTVLGVPGSVPAHIALVPPARAAVLWRSLLSFTNVEPVGRLAARSALAQAHPWGPALALRDRLELSAHDLESLGLLRRDGGYVGARALGRG